MLRKIRLLIKDKNLQRFFINFTGIFLVLMSLHQITFYFISAYTANKTLIGVKGLLRQQFADSDPYKISQTLNDLENMGFLNCSKLINNEQKNIYIDLSYRHSESECKDNWLTLNGNYKEVILTGINNGQWKVQFISNNDSFFHWTRLITGLLIFLITLTTYILNYSRKRKQEIIDKLKTEKVEALWELSKKVAHDIRSPLASLENAIMDLGSLPERRRTIIRGSARQIKDIANNLLNNNHNDIKNEQKQVLQIATLIEEVISEKRMQYRYHQNLCIESQLDIDSKLNVECYSCFINVEPSGLKRVFSNLINNSVEAMEKKDTKGHISINFRSLEGSIQIEIQDNGKGIPDHILSKLGHGEITFGKVDGHGIGLSQAIVKCKEWGGKLSIQSKLNQGTTITLEFPKVDAPEWFIPSLKLNDETLIAILDDDQSIHQTWEDKLSELGFNIYENIFHFNDPNELIQFYDQLNSDPNISTDTSPSYPKEKFIFLIDFEYIGKNENGINVIKKLKIEEQSILVTSRYNEDFVLSECIQSKIKIIPKTMAGNFPIDFKPEKTPYLEKELKIIKNYELLDSQEFNKNNSEKISSSPSQNTKMIKIVHIEDDEYLRMCWEDWAESNGHKIISIGDPDELEQYKSTLEKDTKFYIDSHLGKDKIKGQDLAKILFDDGYKELYLTTGYNKNDFGDLPFIKNVLGKAPPAAV